MDALLYKLQYAEEGGISFDPEALRLAPERTGGSTQWEEEPIYKTIFDSLTRVLFFILSGMTNDSYFCFFRFFLFRIFSLEDFNRFGVSSASSCHT